MSRIKLAEQATAPDTPPTGKASIYIDATTKKLASKDDAGTVTDYGAAGGGGEANTGANAGSGAGVFRDKTGTTLNFRSIVAATAAVVVSQLTDTIQVAFGHVLTAALNAANFAIQAAKTVTFNAVVDNGNSGTAKTIDWTAGQKQKVVLTGNVTFTFTAPPGPGNFVLLVTQDATGGRTTAWPASVKWPAGAAPAIQSGAAGSVHLVAFFYDGSTYHGGASLNYS